MGTVFAYIFLFNFGINYFTKKFFVNSPMTLFHIFSLPIIDLHCPWCIFSVVLFSTGVSMNVFSTQPIFRINLFRIYFSLHIYEKQISLWNIRFNIIEYSGGKTLLVLGRALKSPKFLSSLNILTANVIGLSFVSKKGKVKFYFIWIRNCFLRM